MLYGITASKPVRLPVIISANAIFSGAGIFSVSETLVESPIKQATANFSGVGQVNCQADLTKPSFVNISARTDVGSDTSMTVTLPTSLISGNLLIGAITVGSTRNPVWPAGWTAIGAGFVAWHICTGPSDTAPTVTWTGAVAAHAYCMQWTGNSTTVGNSSDNQAVSGTPATTAAITTSRNSSLCAAIIASNGCATAPSLPSGFTNVTYIDDATVNMSIRVAEVLARNSGTTTLGVSSTVVSSQPWRAALIEIYNAP